METKEKGNGGNIVQRVLAHPVRSHVFAFLNILFDGHAIELIRDPATRRAVIRYWRRHTQYQIIRTRLSDGWTVQYAVNGVAHRRTGPAVISVRGGRRVNYWFLRGVIRNNGDDGWSTQTNGDKYWLQSNGTKLIRHRTDGPSVVRRDGVIRFDENGASQDRGQTVVYRGAEYVKITIAPNEFMYTRRVAQN